ncbi:hypothetical protein [Bacillus sp. THAF10]|uniref:hypothetical protein n=1 Tax=Bacillus sp. THAF10 TaxID=2587848 RepID=UPI00126962B5|nr:hypothetical protein [Bacillus sp. THAF10]
MQPPKYILSTWKKFDAFPMETLTKMWVCQNSDQPKQRSVSQMKEDKEAFGVTGNCFDLAIWLLDECKKDGVEAYPIGHDLGTEHAHVGVMALDEQGNRYLCDLGDQWLQPILINDAESFTSEKLSGFFPAAEIQVMPRQNEVEIMYHRPNGKVSRQTFHTTPVEMSTFLQAAEVSQKTLRPKPLLECRIPFENEIAHWEFYNWKSFLSTTMGLKHDEHLTSLEEWVERIHQKTGYDKGFLLQVLEGYEKLGNEGI